MLAKTERVEERESYAVYKLNKHQTKSMVNQNIQQYGLMVYKGQPLHLLVN